MVWVEFPKFFCASLNTIMYVYNSIIDTFLLVPWYGSISNIPNTGPGLPHTPDNLTHLYFYMYDYIT